MFYDLYKCTDLLLIMYYIRPGQVFWQGGEVLSGHGVGQREHPLSPRHTSGLRN